MWTNTGDVYANRSAGGTLTVSDGGVVTAKTLYASLGSLLGNGTITVTGGAVLDGSLLFDASHGTVQTVSFGSGGHLNLTVNGASSLGVGYYASGNLRVADAVTVSSTNGCLGYYPGSLGSATITGPGSKWSNSGDFYAGRSGTGDLKIEAGGQLSSATGYIGYLRSGATGATGAVTVTGSGSKWVNTNSIYVGYGGGGTLTVSNGGLVTAKNLFASMNNLFGDGTIGVTGGVVLDGNLVFDGSHGTSQTIAFGSGGKLSLVVDGSGHVGAGYIGTGTLRVTSGVTVPSSYGWLGYHEGSVGTATVSGTRSKWTVANDLTAGYEGAGTLTIDGGGQVASASSYIGKSLLSSGTASVNGAGSKFTNSSNLYVGYQGTGSLSVASGGYVTSASGYLGYDVNCIGTATVTGTSSVWGNTANLYVGFDGSGALEVTAGGEVNSQYTSIDHNSTSLVSGIGSKMLARQALIIHSGALTVAAGGVVSSALLGRVADGAGEHGAVTVTGAGSTWTNGADLYVGGWGTGTLTVSDGGVVTAKTLYASLRNLRGDGTINVSAGGILDTDLVFDGAHGTNQTLAFGTGGTLSLKISGSDQLGVGYQDAGTLRIADGIAITSSLGYLGYCTGSTGTATVSGTGSKWVVASQVCIGNDGNGTLIIEAGAEVSDASAVLGSNAGSYGRVTITGMGSKWSSGSAISVGGAGGGTLTVTDGGLAVAKTLCSAAGSLQGNGTIAVNGIVLDDINVYFDNTHGTTQTLPFGTGGTLNLVADGTGNLGAGYKGVGNLRIADGVVVPSAAGIIGSQAGSNGRVTVTGSGSKWTTSSVLYAGLGGIGVLHIEAGGQVSNTTGYVGNDSSSTGAVTVTGPGSKWINSGSLYVGNSGAGTLGIEAGGQVSNASGYIATKSGSSGIVTVNGTGSSSTTLPSPISPIF